MRNPKTLLTGAALAAVIFVACGGPAPAASGVPTAPPINVPSFAIPSGLLPSGLTIPSFSIPSFPPDPAVEAQIPREIGGQPVTAIRSGNFLAQVQLFNPTQAAAFVTGMQSIGIDPASVGFGSGVATLDDEEVAFQVLRFPGGTAATAIDVLVRIDEPDVAPQLTTETIGGKTVTVATTEGDEEFYYLNGEWGWFLPDATREQAAVIFAALP